jgi:hypothetical protein
MTLSSAEEFVGLVYSGVQEDYQRARWAEAPSEVWREILDRYPDLRSDVAGCKCLPVDILELLANDEDDEVRWWIASKRRAGAAVLESLAVDPNESVRERVAYNPSAPLSALRLLATDACERIALKARERLADRGD